MMKKDYKIKLTHHAITQMREIVQTISLLSVDPYMGTPLNSKYDLETDIRFLIVSKRLAVYRVRGEPYIEITRVIDGWQGYMTLLL